MNIIFSGLIHSFFLLSFIACTLIVTTPTSQAQSCANTGVTRCNFGMETGSGIIVVQLLFCEYICRSVIRD